MLQLARAQVMEIIEQRSDIQLLLLKMLEGDDASNELAFFVTDDQNRCLVGDHVLVNTTAVTLDLGTGGYHVVVCKLMKETAEYFPTKWGHIMKMRYTSMQMAVDAVEEQNSPYHARFTDDSASLKHTPVLIGELHSLLPMVALSLKQINPDYRIVYVMPDGASLPIAYSRHVSILQERDIIASTITVGHAWGGDLEAVTIYTGLLAAKELAKADLILCMLGPGVVGTGTPLGFSGVQLADIIHAVSILEGVPICIPRISFADPRSGHKGISHHTLTILKKLVLMPTLVPIPRFGDGRDAEIAPQLRQVMKNNGHLLVQDTVPSIHQIESIQQKYPESITTMGRDIYQDASTFQTAYVSARIASQILAYQVKEPIAYQPGQDVLETLARLWGAGPNCEGQREFPMIYRPDVNDLG